MANLSYPELAEIRNEDLPPASLNALRDLRTKSCETSRGNFALQSQQKFLRRVLSPDSPVQNVLVVHGTGTGKTCTAIQIAEEYILRPEYQDKKVFVVASAAVQETFRDQIFNVSRVRVDESGLLESSQCTGRRYLDMLLRIESEPKNWKNRETLDRMRKIGNRLIDEFYEMEAYATFGNRINEQELGTDESFRKWVHETFDNRLLIIDEAHAIRESTQADLTIKAVSAGLEKIVKIADGLVLVLLTATPMYDSFSEILFYFNLFLWNDRQQPFRESLTADMFFDEEGNILPGEPETRFRSLCQTYISYVKGENPFTFPFRLPPPMPLLRDEVKKDFLREPMKTSLQFLHSFMVSSSVQGIQKEVLQRSEHGEAAEKRQMYMQPTICVFPENKRFQDVFQQERDAYKYIGEPFLTPETLPSHSAKFASIIKSIETGEGIALVYSNFVTSGVRVFAMALEEHGYTSATGTNLLVNSSYKGKPKGQYVLLTTKLTETELRLIAESKTAENAEGKLIRVLITSPITAEGIDFKYVRQIHLLDPWWNMSRIEQILGRGLRTCSHAILPFEKQNCTVYLHVVRTDDGVECYDEYTYRVYSEQKAIRIAKVRRILAESAMDCPIQVTLNTLPEDWRNLVVPQTRSEQSKPVELPLQRMLAPTFEQIDKDLSCELVPDLDDPNHVRPLSTYLDVSDEILTRLADLFVNKPIWDRKDLIQSMRPYTEDAVIFNLQHAIRTGRRFRDAFNRQSILESKGELYVITPVEMGTGTLIDRVLRPVERKKVDLEVEEKKEEVAEVPDTLLAERRATIKFPAEILTRFDDRILDSYVFDHALTDAERAAYSKDVLFLDRRTFKGETEYVVLGYKKFKPDIEPVGDDETAFREWKQNLLRRFLDARDKIFVSLKEKEKKVTISKLKLNEENIPERLIPKKANNYLPTVCGTGDNKKPVMLALGAYIDKQGKGIPEKATTEEICMYIDLFAREEHNCVWFTPEELSVLYTTDELREAFTKEFKKAKNE